MTRRILLGLLAVAAVAAFAVPAGDHQPLIVRVVTIGERTGPAFYSAIEQGYRFIEPSAILDADRTLTEPSPEADAEAGKTMVTAEIGTRSAR